MKSTLSDQNLLEEFVGGEGARAAGAFEGLVQRHGGMVRASLWRRVKNRALAEEAAQAVFLVLARKAPELVGRGIGRGERLGGWLLKTARYAGIDAMRKEIRQARHERGACLQRPEGAANPPEILDAAEDDPRLAALDEALLALTTEDREAVVLRYFQEQSFDRIAVALETTTATARKRVQRALKKLRVLMKRRGEALTQNCVAGLLLKTAAGARAMAAAQHGILAIAETANVQWRAGRIVRRIVEAKWRMLAAVSAAAMLMLAVGILVFTARPGTPENNHALAQGGVSVAPPEDLDGSGTSIALHRGAGTLTLELSNEDKTLTAPSDDSRGFFVAVLQMKSLAINEEDESSEPPDRVTCLVLGISTAPRAMSEVEWGRKNEKLTLAAGPAFFSTTTREIQEHMLSLAWLPAMASGHGLADAPRIADIVPADLAADERDRAKRVVASADLSTRTRSDARPGGMTILAVVTIPRLFHF